MRGNEFNALFTEEEKKFVIENVKGKSNKELTELVNSKFGLNLTVEQIKSWKNTHHIVSGKRAKPTSFPREVVDYVVQIGSGRWHKETTEMVNEKFGTNYSVQQIAGVCKRNGIFTNKNTKFQKGVSSWNKGMKGVRFSDGRTWFKKGHTPYNTLPVGTTVKDKDGYVKVKVAMPNKWKHAHRMIWEEHNGEIPKGANIIFKDNNKYNLDISNLEMVTNGELLTMNHQGLRFDDAELTEIGILIAKLQIKKEKLIKKE